MAGGTGKIVHQMRLTSGASGFDFKTITAHAVPHTKGVYTELVASLPDDVQFVIIMFHSTSGSTTDSSMLLDIAVGAAASEVVKIPNLPIGFKATAAQTPDQIGLPIAIPSGSRVAARIQALATLDVALVAMDFYGELPGPAPADTVDVLGASEANSGGVQLTAGSANVKGAWAEISASTPNAYKALGVSFGGSSGTMQISNCLVDVGVGAAASEAVVVGDIAVLESLSEHWQAINRGIWPLENEIAAGSRIAARIQSSVGSNADMELVVVGIK